MLDAYWRVLVRRRSAAKGRVRDVGRTTQGIFELHVSPEGLIDSKEPDDKLYRPALETLRTLIRTSTSSMTSVPKPLKFLRPHYPDLQTQYEKWPPSEDKVLSTDFIYCSSCLFTVESFC